MSEAFIWGIVILSMIAAVLAVVSNFMNPPEGQSLKSKSLQNPLKRASVFIGLMPLVGILSFMLIYSSPESYAFISIVSGGISFFLFYGFVINLYQAGAQNQNPS
jgi:hypothetical protein